MEHSCRKSSSSPSISATYFSVYRVELRYPIRRSVFLSRGQLRGGLQGQPSAFPLPGKQFVQAGDRKIGDPGQHVGEPGFWIDVIETTGRDEGEHDGGTIGPALGTCEGPVAAPQGNPSQGPFGGIVRETNPAILQEAGKAIPALQHVINGSDHLGRSAERDTLPFQPLVHVIE